jgi:predicted PurR-regulated permease PerM
MPRLAESSTALKLGFLPTAFAIVAALYFAQEVFIPLAVAVLLTFLLAPAVTWLERRGMKGVLAVLLVVAASLGVLGTITWTVQRQFIEVAGKLPDYQDNIRDKLDRFRGATGGRFSKAARGVKETVRSEAGSQPSSTPSVTAESATAAQGSDGRPGAPTLPPVSPQNPLPVREYSEPSSPLQIVGHYLGQLLSPLATVGLIVIFVIFMLLNRRDLRDRMIRLVGHGRVNVTTQALDDAATRISHYLLTQLAINTIYGASVGLGLWIIGLCSAEGHFPNVLLWALLATALRFVPYAGPM